TAATAGFPRFFVVTVGLLRSENFPTPYNQFFVGSSSAPTGGTLPVINSVGPKNHASGGSSFPFQINGNDALSTMNEIKFLKDGQSAAGFTLTSVQFDAGT